VPEALWGEPVGESPVRAGLAAAREINRTRVSYLEDLDKLRRVLAGGGTFPEMRAAVNAFQVIDNIIGELETAAKRAADRVGEEQAV
jgi:hypothetical protein